MGSWTSKFGRRRALACLAGTLLLPDAPAQNAQHRSPIPHPPSPVTPFAPVVPGYRLRYPRDEGSHPEFRIEWWYVTGWLDATGHPLGFQITFFRARPDARQDNPSAFAPRQIMVAHAAISDAREGRLIHAQRAARSAFELAGAERGRMAAWIDDWRLERTGTIIRAAIPARELGLALDFEVIQPPLEQGSQGYSRKGPAPESASYYYSLPHLRAAGTLVRGGKRESVRGSAWLDHEWSSQYLEPAAAGWDWIGINLDDGGALMAFRIRNRDGGQHWAGGSLRRPDGGLRDFSPGEIAFEVRRHWKSARTGVTYPVSFLVRAGGLRVLVEPLFEDQENDTRATTGAIYWEGAVRATAQGKLLGRGYLELTGYARPLRL